MTIETGSAQNTSRPAATETKHAKGKPGDAHGHGAGGLGGFMAVLASLDTPELTDPGLAQDPAALALAALQRAAAALKGNASGDVSGTGDGAATDLGSTELDIDKLLPGAVSDMAALVPISTEVPLQPELPVDASALLAQAAQWANVPAAGGEQARTDAAAGVVSGLVTVAKPSAAPARPEPAAQLGAVGVDAPASDVAGKAGKAQKEVLARLASAQAALAAPAEAGTPAPDPRQLQVAQKVVEAPLGTIATALAAANMVSPARREETARERSAFRTSVSESAAPGQSYAPAVNGASAVIAPEPVTSTDSYVTEKVAYWISNDVQNAEMKLDGIGDKPVEVSIRMQGNEAHVAFRSDELQARAALENASQHLKDMLQREGLVLSGVSVGTAGAGDSGDQERRPRQGARQTGVVSVQPASVDRATISGRATGGALDLFV